MAARSEIVAELAARIRRIERAGTYQAPNIEDDVEVPAASALTSLWPNMASLRGRLVEWLANAKGAGATSLAVLASQAAFAQDLWVVVDGRKTLHGPGLVPLSLDLNRVVLVRPERPQDVLWAVEQSLRTRGVGVVVCEVDQLTPAAFRRLQLAAETGGTLGVLLRPERMRQQPTWAEFRFLVRPLAMRDIEKSSGAIKPRRRLLVELLRAPGNFTAKAVIVELDDANGRLCMVTQLASAATAVRATGA